MQADTKGLQTERLCNHSCNQIFSLCHTASYLCTRTLKKAHMDRRAQAHTSAQDTGRVVVPFHSCEHLVQLCNGEFGLMKHMGDGALTQRMADSVCVCVHAWVCVCFGVVFPVLIFSGVILVRIFMCTGLLRHNHKKYYFLLSKYTILE